MGEKCPNLVSQNDTIKESDLAASKEVSQVQPQQVHKWPLRPGVHVHVNGLNTLTGGQDSKVNHQISGFTYGAKTSRSSSSSGSDWASNTSSNPDLNNSDQSDSKHRLGGGKPNMSALTTHQELSGTYGPSNDLQGNGTRPNSRQQRKKREAVNKNLSHMSEKNLSHISGSDQLLPTFYENVSSIQNRQKSLGKPSNKRKKKISNKGCVLYIEVAFAPEWLIIS